MPERGDSFTLYLRGAEGPKLRAVLKPYGNGGDLERWKLDSWDAEVIHGGGAQVALIRVSYANDAGSVRTLIHELHQAAAQAGLVLSDDVNSSKTEGELIASFGIEGERGDVLRAGRPSARWSLTKKFVVLLLTSVLLAIVYAAFKFLGVMAEAFKQGR
jgi:hypothetical protein